MDKKVTDAPWHEEADELVVLVEVVLRLDVVFAAAGRADKLELGGQGDIGVVKGNQPDGEELGNVEVDKHARFIVSWDMLALIVKCQESKLSNGIPTLFTLSLISGLKILYHR